jgi:hypothetical protein
MGAPKGAPVSPPSTISSTALMYDELMPVCGATPHQQDLAQCGHGGRVKARSGMHQRRGGPVARLPVRHGQLFPCIGVIAFASVSTPEQMAHLLARTLKPAEILGNPRHLYSFPERTHQPTPQCSIRAVIGTATITASGPSSGADRPSSLAKCSTVSQDNVVSTSRLSADEGAGEGGEAGEKLTPPRIAASSASR